MKKIMMLGMILLLSGCSVWQDEFDEPVTRAMPKASIHKISTMVDKGIIKESDVADFAGLCAESTNHRIFMDGSVSRGMEEVNRIYLLSYEDSDKTFHSAHHLYVVLQPAQWVVTQ